jgi:hypothetical protein
MADSILTSQIAGAILQEMRLQKNAEIFEGTTRSPFEIQTLVLDLSTAKTVQDPYIIGFPFKSLFVRDATDATVNVSLKPQTRDSFQSGVTLRLNDSLDFDVQQSSGFISWAAQSGKSITLVFFVNAAFKSGSQVAQSAGGVAIIDGTSYTDTAATTVATTEQLVFALDSTRKKGTIQNGTGGSVFVGKTGVTNTGATRGFEILPGETFYWRNTASLYAYPMAASTNGLFLRSET